MATLEELTLYFYIGFGIVAIILFVILSLVVVLFIRMSRLISDKSNQLARQKEMMADFCYTNPTIVPGEELSRRGFSMYSGSNHNFSNDDFDNGHHGKDYNNHEEARSKF